MNRKPQPFESFELKEAIWSLELEHWTSFPHFCSWTQAYFQILDSDDLAIDVFLRREHLYKSHTSLKKKVNISIILFVAQLFTNVSYTNMNIQEKDASNKKIVGVILLMKEGTTVTSTSQIHCLSNREFVSYSK